MRQKAIEHFEAFGFTMNSDEKWTKGNVIVDITDSDIAVYGMMPIDAPLCIVEQQPLFINHIWDLVFDPKSVADAPKSVVVDSVVENTTAPVTEIADEPLAPDAEKAKRSRRKKAEDAV